MNSKAYFDSVAGDWDTIRSGFFSENVRETALKAANVQRGQLAADVGAGSGFVTEALLNAGLNVIAVDQSQAMLHTLQNRFPGADVKTRLGDSTALEDSAVDYAFANMFLHHVEDPAATIKDMARTLKPGGKLVITDLDEHEYEFLHTEQHDRWLGFKRADVETWFREAGLQNVTVDCIDGENCCADSACSTQRAEISIFVAYGEK